MVFLCLIVAGLTLVRKTASTATPSPLPSGLALATAVLLVVHPVIYTYDGWYSVIYFGDEIEQYGDEWWEHVEIDFYRERDNRWWNQLSARNQARWLLGQLWHCTDILPGDVRSVFEYEDHEGFTYAQLARLLAKDLKPITDAAAA